MTVLLCIILTLLTTLPATRGQDASAPDKESDGASDSVCYEELGCFPCGPPWSGTFQRPERKTPWTPEQINTQFFLWTRKNPQCHQTLTTRNLGAITASSFSPSRRSAFIIHGMADRANDSWVSTMCQELLRAEDMNCVGVDWRRGSGSMKTYAQAASNVRVVGAEIASFIKYLEDNLAYDLKSVHLIGHSLGSHIAGEAGRRVPGIRRISALDAARPYFEDTPEEVRLDKSDAQFVDVIHTDTGLIGAGMVKPIGHLDFYPNGGKFMTGCPSKLSFLWAKDNMLEAVACNHFMAFRYYTHSIRHPDAFTSYPCDSYSKFTSGACFPCPPDTGCPSMGHAAERAYSPSTQPLKLYLNTGGDPSSYYRCRYKVSVRILGIAHISANIFISLQGSGGNMTDHQLYSGRLNPGDTRDAFIDSPTKLHPIDHVTLLWTSPFYNFFRTLLGASRVSIQSGADGTTWSFCSNQTVLDGVRLELSPCSE